MILFAVTVGYIEHGFDLGPIILVDAVAIIFFSPHWAPRVYRTLKRLRQAGHTPSWLQQRRLRAIGFDKIDKMSGIEFEDRMYVYFKDIGWKAEKTPVSGDYGADLILTTPEGNRIAAQLKRYSGQVGVDAVQEVAAAIPFYKADSGMIITNSHLTANAQKLASIHEIETWEREDLAKKLLAQQNKNS